MKKYVAVSLLALAVTVPVHAFRAGTRTGTFTAGPYVSGNLGLGLAVTNCINKIHEDCFFWTPAGCDGVSSNPVFTLTSVNSYPLCEGQFCIFNTYCSGSCVAQCELIGPERPPIDNCPIVLPMGPDHRAHLTDVTRGVDFDIDADGNADRISWTDPRSHTVFLALDRDGDHLIANGSELFGSSTEQVSSPEPNGFRALSELDAFWAGGNGDGFISAADEKFADLLLWDDKNHDGKSQPEELQPLGQSGVVRISLRYRDVESFDQFGNHLRFHARVDLIDGRTQAIDVLFLGE